MKRSSLFLRRAIVVIQLCIALFLGLYSFVICIQAGREQDNCARVEQEWQDAAHQAKTLEAQLSVPPVNFAHDAYNSARYAEYFSTTVFIISIILFLFGLFSLIQLLSVQKLERPPTIDSSNRA